MNLTQPQTTEGPHDQPAIGSEVKGILGNLPPQTVFAFLGTIPGLDALIWQFGPSLQTSLQILMDLRASMYGSPFLQRELEPSEVYFSAQASQVLPKHELMGDVCAHAANCLNRLTQIKGMCFAVAWQVPGDDVCELSLWGYDLVDAFEDFADSMAQTVRQQLEA